MKINYFKKAAALITTGVLLLSVPFQALAVESTEEAGSEGQTVQESIVAIEEAAEQEQTSTETVDSEEVPAEDVQEASEDISMDEENTVAADIPLETEGFCGETLSWKYEDGKLYIEGTGEMYDYNSDVLPGWVAYRDVASELYIGRTVTLIDLDAFAGFSFLEKVFFEGTLSEWGSLYFTGSKENFGEEITADEIFTGAEICFAAGEESEEEYEPVDQDDVEPVDQDDIEPVPSDSAIPQNKEETAIEETLFDQPKEEEPQFEMPSPSRSATLKQIILVYSDNTFEQVTPR